MALLPRFCHLLGGWRRCFRDRRTFRRAQEHALALLVGLGRRTLSRSICVLGRQFRNWTPEYRLFSRCRWQSQALFDAVLAHLPALLSPSQPLVVALDDTPCRKTGKRIRAAKMLRDPLSPPYHLNLCRALRFLQATVLLWPTTRPGSARAIPIAFDLAPPVAKPKPPRRPRKGASRQEWAAYARTWRGHHQALRSFRRQQQAEGLSAQGARLLNSLCQRCQAVAAWKERLLWAVVDASFCNRTVFRLLDRGIVLIGRTRKDLRLYRPAPPPRPGRGRQPTYGPGLSTPEALRQDATQPWQSCAVFAAGQHHTLHYKTLAPVLWRSGAGPRPLRLIVIRPLRYRAHGHTLYRHPAYLLVSDPALPVPQILQAYCYRWEIEVDQKEEKDLLGVGQAQVWSEVAVGRQPAFHVAAYATLLVAAVQAYGLNNPAPAGHLPLWRQRKPPRRWSTAHLLANLRQEIQDYETLSSPNCRRRKPREFVADALAAPFGKKFPITTKTILSHAWT